MKKRTLSGLTALALSLSIVSGFPQELFWNISDSSSVMTVNAEETEPAVNEPEPGETETQATEAETQPTINETEPAETEAAVNEIAPVGDEAAYGNIVETGQCGDNVFYELDSEGTLTISGSGDMYDYETWKYDYKNYSPFLEREDIINIIIKNGVTSIGDHSFSDCIHLTNITIPEGITSIGTSSFYKCSSLNIINIPQSVTSIGFWAFSYCSSLSSISIPNGVTSIGDSTFSSCIGLIDVSLPDTIISIGESAFWGCSNLSNIVIPCGVTEIESSTFYKCTSLTNITIPDSVVSIGYNAFYGCSNIESVVIPNSVVEIGRTAFKNCTNLQKITAGDNITSIEDDSFEKCGIKDLTISYGSTNIPARLIEVTKSENIIIPDTFTVIGEDAFKMNDYIKNIEIPNTVTTICDYAFYGCSSLENINIPNNLTSIGNGAFSDCTSLMSIKIPNSVTFIGKGAFSRCTGLISIEIPNRATSIDERVFSNCDNLTNITIPNSVTSIGKSAFWSCDSLTSITIPNSVTSIGDYAFGYCESLTSITIPNSITSIGILSFEYCDNLTIYGYTGSSSESYAIVHHIPFKVLDSSETPDKTPLENFKIVQNYDDPTGETYKIISYEGTDENVVIPAACADGNITAIHQFAFSGKTVKSVTISENITDINNSAFSTASALESISVNENNTSFKAEDGILYNYDMTKLICYPEGKDGMEFTVPESVTAIESFAFDNVALKKITIGKNVTEMRTNSFFGSQITIYGYTGSYAETYAKEKNIPFKALDGGSEEEPDPETCEHTYSTKYSSDAADHWHVCTICGAEQLGSRSPHTFSTKYTSDAGYHWHVCTICGTEQLGSRTRHSFGDFVVTKEPTETEKGSKEAECKYCGYIKIEEIPKLAGTIYVNEGETYSTTNADARKSFVVNGGKLNICSSVKEVTVNSGEALSIINSKIDSVIINGGKFTSSGKINGDVLVTGKSGFLNTQIGGTYAACDGTEIGGNLTIEKNGVFEMNGGNVKVCNNFTFASQYEQETSLLSGSLWIGGDFIQKNQPFKPYRDSYTVIFYGNSRKTVTYKNVVIPNLWITPEADDGTNLNQVFKIKNVPNGIFRCNSEGTKTVANRNEYIIGYVSWQKELVDNMDKLYDSHAELTNNNFGVLDGITIDNKYKKEINRQVMAWYAIISSDYAKDTKEFNKGCGIQFKEVPVKVNRHSYKATITFGFVDFMKGINNSPYLPTNPVTGGINFNGIHYIIEVDDIHKTSSGSYNLAASTDQTKFARAVVNTINNGVRSDIESIFKKLGLSAFEIPQMTSNHFIEAIFQIYDSYKIVEGEVNKYKSFVGMFTPIYIAKYQIDQHCPVDTYVYNENGVLIASIVNNEVVMDNDDVVIWIDGESKFIRFNNDKYTVKTIGNNSGTMDCEIRQYNDNYELVKRDMYDALAVSDGKIYVSGINIDENLVLMEENSGVNIPIEPDEEYFPEIHHYQDTWNWNSTFHWHECACGDKADIAQHISNGGIVTVQPTAYSTGVRTYSCTVCGYVIGSEIIPTTGNYVPSVNVLPYASIFPTATATVTHPVLKATAETKNDTVTLKWNKINNAKKYTVYQLINGKYVKVKDTNNTTVTFKKLKNGNTYKFIVRYTVNGKESSNAYSGRISVTLRYKPVVKAAATQNSVRLVWNDIPNSQKYAVYKYANGKAVKLIETKKTSVKINKLTSKTEYQYIVCAYVNGKWTTMTKSDIVTVKTE